MAPRPSTARPATENRNPRTVDIDTVPTSETLRMLLDEEVVAVEAARAAVPDLTRLVEYAAECLRRGGHVHYAGAGASGRLATLDATETTPTFGVDPDLFQAHFPGGAAALVDSAIDLEDARQQGRLDLNGVTERDLVVGITASGQTPYVDGALSAARETGAVTALITSNPDAPLHTLADVLVVADTGAEALTGSTRLKAGTAAKVMLNAFSTALMIASGRTYSNLMVGLKATNEKLRQRSVDLLTEATGEPSARCERMLRDCEGDVSVALVRILAGCSLPDGRDALRRTGNVRAAVQQLARP